MRRRPWSTNIRKARAIRTTRCRAPSTLSSTGDTRNLPTRRMESTSSVGWRRTGTTTWIKSSRRHCRRRAASPEPMTTTQPELWAGFECTVNRVGDRRFDQLALSGHDKRDSDLELLGELGVHAVRYPVLWERVERDGWGWSDRRLARLRELGIQPIVGLVHHGSGPPRTNLLDSTFAEQLAAFAGEAAARYPWVEAWTPINEPLTTARFSALYGHWYPHAR